MSVEMMASMLFRSVAAKAAPAETKKTGSDKKMAYFQATPAARDALVIKGDPIKYVLNLQKALNSNNDEKNIFKIKGLVSAVGFGAGAIYIMVIVSGAVVASPIITAIVAVATAASMFYGIGCGIQFSGAETKEQSIFNNIVDTMRTLKPAQNAQIISEMNKTDPALAARILTAMQK